MHVTNSARTAMQIAEETDLTESTEATTRVGTEVVSPMLTTIKRGKGRYSVCFNTQWTLQMVRTAFAVAISEVAEENREKSCESVYSEAELA